MRRSQCKQIIDYMKTHESGITPYEALELFGCLRLSARIHDLRDEGYSIVTEAVHKGGKQFACYKLDADGRTA